MAVVCLLSFYSPLHGPHCVSVYDMCCCINSIADPLRFWEEANLPKTVMAAITSAGYKQPSPIQRQAIPIGLRQRDIIGVAETGSGKTCAFIIPLLVYLSKVPKEKYLRVDEDGPLAVIMAPTRELAQQVRVPISVLLVLAHCATALPVMHRFLQVSVVCFVCLALL